MDQPAQRKPTPTGSTRYAETIRQIMAVATVPPSAGTHRPLPALDWPRRLFADASADADT